MDEEINKMETDDLITIDSIIAWMKRSVEEKKPIAPSTWLDAAAKLNVLMGDLDDEIMQAKFAYESLQRKRDRIVELGRIAKKRTELREWE